MIHNVVHFAIHAGDVERARKFYEGVFGWKFQAWGPPGFYQISTGRDNEPGIMGALHQRSEPLEGRGMRGFECTVSVEDIVAAKYAVVRHGGKLISEEIEIPEVGVLFQFLDTEGNVLNAMCYLPGALPGTAPETEEILLADLKAEDASVAEPTINPFRAEPEPDVFIAESGLLSD